MYDRAEEGAMKWFGHMERMIRRVYTSEVEGPRKRGTPRNR